MSEAETKACLKIRGKWSPEPVSTAKTLSEKYRASQHLLNVTGHAPAVNMTGQAPAVNMTGHAPAVNITEQAPGINMTGHVPAVSMSGHLL
jgi:hypothetical protein